ncbi:Putative nuclease HARBI1, partial [Trachymyrmex cornetzi]
LEILNINARFPGSVHDAFIWRYSAARNEMIYLYDSDDRLTWLLGDADYFLEPWLMTPITNAQEGSAEARYTQHHSSVRNCIERTFGLLKNVWRCLLSHRVLPYDHVTAANIIVACAVLDNIRLRYNLMNNEIDIDEEGEDAAQQKARLQNNLQICNRIRNQAEEINVANEAHINDRLTETKSSKKNSSHSI